MKKKSVIGNTSFILAVQSVLITGILVLYIVFSFMTAVEGLKANMNNLSKLYGESLQTKLKNSEVLLERLIYKNSDYDMLLSEEESVRHYAAVRIKHFIQEQITYDPYVDAIVIAENSYDSCLDYNNVELSLSSQQKLREFTMAKAEKQFQKSEWDIAKIGEASYVYKMYVWQGIAAGIFIKVEHFMEETFENNFGNVSFLLLDNEKKICGVYGSKVQDWKIGERWKEPHPFKKIGILYSLSGDSIQLYANVNVSNIIGQFRIHMFVMASGIIILILCSFWLIRFLKKEMIFPLMDMQGNMSKICEEDYTLRIEEEYGSQEFTLLKDAFNRLMDEIVGLKIESYERQINLQEAELKCIRLQIKPHFFLNAMTTISSLSQQGRDDEIQKYIAALSKNIRYMFRSGLHTVSLSEEVHNVENYFAMQEMKYPGCVFYYIDIPAELKYWQIPQMILHTIIENEYKYAVSIDSMLTILIRAELRELNGEELLLLEVEDDGNGYPKEVLQKFSENEDIGSDGERIGLWSIRRMMKLMYERDGLFEIDNIVPHGCKNVFLIPRHAVQEFKENTNDESRQ